MFISFDKCVIIADVSSSFKFDSERLLPGIILMYFGLIYSETHNHICYTESDCGSQIDEGETVGHRRFEMRLK